MEGFGDRFEPMQSKDSTRVAFQNCGRWPQLLTSKMVTDGALIKSAGKYNTLLFAEHGLYSPTLDPKHQIYGRVCVMNKRTLTRLSYNTNDGEGTR